MDSKRKQFFQKTINKQSAEQKELKLKTCNIESDSLSSTSLRGCSNARNVTERPRNTSVPFPTMRENDLNIIEDTTEQYADAYERKSKEKKMAKDHSKVKRRLFEITNFEHQNPKKKPENTVTTVAVHTESKNQTNQIEKRNKAEEKKDGLVQIIIEPLEHEDSMDEIYIEPKEVSAPKTFEAAFDFQNIELKQPSSSILPPYQENSNYIEITDLQEQYFEESVREIHGESVEIIPDTPNIKSNQPDIVITDASDVAHEQPTTVELIAKSHSDDIQPTILDIIPEEKLMEVIRDSIVGNTNEDVEISVCQENNATTVKKNKKERRRKRREKMKTSYVDFLSDDEDFVWDSSSWKGTTDEDSSSSSQEPKKKRKRTKKQKGKDPETEKDGENGVRQQKVNKRQEVKECRNKGQRYIKKDGSIVNERKMKPNPCMGKKCGHKCEEITEEKRKSLFDYYWKLSPERRKQWLIAQSNKTETKRKRVKDSTYRTCTFEYFINDGEGRRQVCLKFLLNTLDIRQKSVHYTLSNASYGLPKDDLRGRTIPSNKTSESSRNAVRNFIKNLPALPSHYCRKESTRLYLPTELKNIKNLYRIYKEDFKSKGMDVVSEGIFRDIFNKEFNIGFHVPKKDKCVKCMQYEADPTLIKQKEDHLAEKDASKQRLSCHRELCKSNPAFLCTSFDLQKVLNTPHGNSILLFYSRKYAVYNLCFYESVTKQGYCFVWGETDGKRGGNEIATVIDKYIKIVDTRGMVKNLLLYSDCCPGQNRNKIVLAAVHNALLHSKNIESIQLNYLLPGHTEMTVDSMHSVIENSVRNTTVWAPSQWLTVCQVARKEVAPYHVEWLDHNDFKNYEEFSDKYFKGNLTGKISKIRVVTAKKSTPTYITVKYSMKEESESEIIQVVGKQKLINPKLYKTNLPITKAKYNDLKKLCETGVIPKIFHREYLSLLNVNGTDVLIDTDVEDQRSDEE